MSGKIGDKFKKYVPLKIKKIKICCSECGEELSTYDYGFYCSNKKCKLYDKNIEAYEE